MKKQAEKSGITVNLDDLRKMRHPNAEAVTTPVSGRIIWELDAYEPSIPPVDGTRYNEGDVFCYVQTPYANEVIKTNWSGKLVEVVAEQGKVVKKGDILAFIEK